MRKILLLAYYFPPCSEGGVMRIRAFTKYLSKHDWQPIVLTVNDQHYLPHTKDDSLVAELPERVIVSRTDSLEPKGKLATSFKTSVYGIQTRSTIFDRLMKPILRKIYQMFVIPDQQILWLPHALRRGCELIKQYDVDAILVTTPPHSTGVIAAILSQLTGKPLILDVRDDWINNPLFDSGPWHRHAFSHFLERQIVRIASRVITVTRESVNAFIEKHPQQPCSKFEWIPNGFDQHELNSLKLDLSTNLYASSQQCLRLVYIGTLNAKRSPACLFKAIRQLDNQLSINNKFKLDIYGYSRSDFQELSSRSGLDGIVEFHGFVSRSESLRQLLLSDAALMIIPEDEGSATAIPGKLYEYIGAGKFVLGLCSNDSASGKLINELNIGMVASPGETEQIIPKLREMLMLYQKGQLNPSPNPGKIQIYERQAQAARLSEILHQVIGNKT